MKQAASSDSAATVAYQPKEKVNIIGSEQCDLINDREEFKNFCLCTSRISIEDHGEYLNYPFVKDPKAILYISESKVMFLMRGLPGSGKSTVAKCLKKVYPNSVICSADYYFNRDGRYSFDHTLLPEAHNSCKQETIRAAVKHIPVIIIDNTNLQLWEMKFYLNLSREYNYVCVIAEPKTPWSKNPTMLAEKNSHSISMDIIEKKFKHMKKLGPVYFGWFLNESDSALLQQMGISWLQRILDHPKVFEEFSKQTKLGTFEDILQYYSDGRYSLSSRRIVHCTSKYTANKNLPGVSEYTDHIVVQHAIGSVHRLCIVGYIITPRTFGARVLLNNKQLTLWGGDDAVLDTKDTQVSDKPPPSNPAPNAIDIPEYELPPDKLSPTATLAVVPQDADLNRFCPTSGKGSRAHLTLATAPDVSPVTTGTDLLEVINLEAAENDQNSARGAAVSYSIPGSVVKYYGNGIFAIYPDKKAEVDSMFSYYI